MRFAALLAVAALAATELVTAQSDNSPSGKQLTLLHRLLIPSVDGDDPPAFLPRASLDLVTRQLTPVPTFHDDLAAFYRDARQSPAFASALYQVAFYVGPEHSLLSAAPSEYTRLSISSARACHLPLAPADYLTLHVDSHDAPYHLDYFLAAVPPSGACPSKKQLQAIDLDHQFLLPPVNSSISIRQPTRPPLPQLRVPPPLSPKGEPIVPPPEKSFLQKYWIYIAVILVVFLATGGPPEEEGGQSRR